MMVVAVVMVVMVVVVSVRGGRGIPHSNLGWEVHYSQVLSLDAFGCKIRLIFARALSFMPQDKMLISVDL